MMTVSVNKLTDISLAHKAIESTVRVPMKAKATLDKIYKWEHSPTRTQLFWIEITDIPTFVSVHLVRHSATGQQHFVQSNRPDRDGEGEANRLTPIKHSMLLNAQHLIDMSRKRLCYQASLETRTQWLKVQDAISKVDPDLAKHMVPNCIYRGNVCPEPKPCGNYKVRKYDPSKLTDEALGRCEVL